MKIKSLAAYRLLEIPLVYFLAQTILAPGAQGMLRKKFKSVFAGSKGLVLDVGCGPELNTPAPEGIIIGLDINHEYIKKYLAKDLVKQKGYQVPKSKFGLVCSADLLSFDNNTFDECRNFGFLHHLSNQRAVVAIREMFRCTRPGGSIVIIDTPLPKKPYLRPLAWLIDKLDRGKWIRTEKDWLELVQTAYPGDWRTERFTYTYTGIEALVMQIKKAYG